MASKWFFPAFLAAVCALIALGYFAEFSAEAGVPLIQDGAARAAVAMQGGSPVYSPRLVEDRSVYKDDVDDHVDYLYITVLPAKRVNGVRGPTWSDLNEIDYGWNNDETPFLDILFQEGTEDGPAQGMFGYGETQANASITLRGRSSRRWPQKSYKIRLFENSGYWQNQKVINLVKSPNDLTRIRNKLSFDYFEEIPDFTSLRTRFTRVFVKDLSEAASADAPGKFVDYGLFTQIEQPNKLFLRSHGLDPYGHLYKANFFEFLRYEDQLRLATDPLYDETAFESILEIEGDRDHSKLLKMLDDVNDFTKDFDEVFEEHFDLDNFLTWTAVNILFDNVDTTTQNFFLYSPLNSKKWFFLPWDYDKGWGYTTGADGDSDYSPMWQHGLANYWGMMLHNRFFRKEGAVELLNRKIEELLDIVTEEKTAAMVERYREAVEPIIWSPPDIGYMPGTYEQYAYWMERLPTEPMRNVQEYYEYLEKPMPIFLGDVVQENGKLKFVWDHSFDLQGDDLVYDFYLATDIRVENVIVHVPDLTVTSLELGMLPEGEYYWRVMVRDEHGNVMEPFDYIDEGDWFHGVRRFEVTAP